MVLLALSCLAAAPATASGTCERRPDSPPMAGARVDNDVLDGRDRDYSNGLSLVLVSPDLVDFTHDPCLPPLARWLNRGLQAIQPGDFEQGNLVLTLAHEIYTPGNHRRSDLIADDRPYAAAILLGLGYNARNDDRLRATQLRLGLVGPSARGEQIQNGMHGLVGIYRFHGWKHQLRDEPVFMLQHARLRRYAGDDEGGFGGDAIVHYGGALGTLATFANAGVEFRYGLRLPDDFGSAALGPGGENTAPRGPGGRDAQWHWHGFVAIDARGVLRDITLDGNTWRDSHRVDKRSWVASAGYGLVLIKGGWKFSLARYHGTRQFETQRRLPVFGSLTIIRDF